MTLQLYDLAGADPNLRFSPYCWRTKMALRHKGLAVETVPWRFTEKDTIKESGQGRVPVLVDNGRWVHDSWAIAQYLDETYPDQPALMPRAADVASARLVTALCDGVVAGALRTICVMPVLQAIHDKDQAYFRETREAALGTSLEALCPDEAAARGALAGVLAPFETTLASHDFLGGDRPLYADYALFGSLMWPYVVCPVPPLAADTSVAMWFDRMLDLFDGYAGAAPTVRT